MRRKAMVFSNFYFQEMSKQRSSLCRLRAGECDESGTFDRALDMAGLAQSYVKYQSRLESSANTNAEFTAAPAGSFVHLRLESHGAQNHGTIIAIHV